MKRRRLEAARQQAAPVARRLAQDEEALMLMASALYLGEGAKGESAFSFANSDPRIIQAWMALLRNNFEIDESKFACQVHITQDMNLEEARRFWSEVTGIPLSRFHKGTVDQRRGSKRRPGYKGVCAVVYYSLALKRYLEALAQGVIDELLSNELT